MSGVKSCPGLKFLTNLYFTQFNTWSSFKMFNNNISLHNSIMRKCWLMVNKISSCQRSNFLEQMYLIHDWLQIKEKRETVKHNWQILQLKLTNPCKETVKFNFNFEWSKYVKDSPQGPRINSLFGFASWAIDP